MLEINNSQTLNQSAFLMLSLTNRNETADTFYILHYFYFFVKILKISK